MVPLLNDTKETPAAASSNVVDAQPELTAEQKKEQATALLAKGKRALLADSLPEADTALSECSKLSAEVYGEFAVECYEPYFCYGKALLELSRLEPGVFGNALDGVAGSTDEEGETEEDEEQAAESADDDQGASTTDNKGTTDEAKDDTNKDDEQQFEDADALTAEERAEIREDVEEALAENAEAIASGEPLPSAPSDVAADGGAEDDQGTDVRDDLDAETKAEADADQTESDDAEVADTNMEEEEAAEEATEDQVQNIQLAWEMLEMARVVCEKQLETDGSSKTEWERRLCETLLITSDAAMENDNAERAVEDLNRCLELQGVHYSDDHRSIAETHFQMGRALLLLNQFDDAVTSFEASLGVIEKRIGSFEKRLDEAAEDEKPKVEQELKSLRDLMPDIKAKIDDCKASKEAMLAKALEEANATNGKEENGANELKEGTVEPAKDITHLIRKPLKRGGDTATADGGATGDAAAPAKRPKASDAENGVANGHSEKVNGHEAKGDSVATESGQN